MANPNTVTTTNTQTPRGLVQFIQTIAVSITPLQTATITVAEQSFGANGASFVTAATGIKAGDVILSISPPSTVAGVGISQYRVDTAVDDKFYISFVNPTAAGVTMPSGIYLITVARFIPSVSTTPGTLSSLPTAITSN